MKRILAASENFLPYNPNLKDRARELRNNLTPAEKQLWYQYLCDYPLRVLRQRPIGNYIVDFYCPKLKLVIEIDGDSHFPEEGQDYDEKRTALLESYGLTLIRFGNDEVLNNFEVVCSVLEDIAKTSVLDGETDTSQEPCEEGF